MKKKVFTSALLIMSTMLLAGCGNMDEGPSWGGNVPYRPMPNDDSSDSSKRNGAIIMSPTGAPALAMSYYAAEGKLETTSDPSLLPGYLAKGDYDMIVAPTDVGVKAIKNGCNYQIAATITFGNFYLVATGTDSNGTLDAGDSIVLFNQNGLPDKVFHYIYGTQFDSNITYVKNITVAAAAYESKKVTTDDGRKITADYVLLSEPKLAAMNIQNGVTDLSEAFKEKSGTSRIFQASIFVNKNAKTNISKELEYIDGSINAMMYSAVQIQENMSVEKDPQTFFGIPPTIAVKVTQNGNGFAFGFEYTRDVKAEMNEYLSILGVPQLTDEEIFKE